MKQDKNATRPSGVSRRTVVKGAAWAVPAITVASAVPAMAASKPDIEIDWGSSTACKIPGASFSAFCYNKGYVLWGVFTNNTALDATVTITGITVGNIARCLVGLTDYTTCSPLGTLSFTVGAGLTRYVANFSNSSTDSSSTTVTVDFDYTLTGQTPASSSQSGDVGGSPWQGSCDFPPKAGIDCDDKMDNPLTACGTPCAST